VRTGRPTSRRPEAPRSDTGLMKTRLVGSVEHAETAPPGAKIRFMAIAGLVVCTIAFGIEWTRAGRLPERVVAVALGVMIFVPFLAVGVYKEGTQRRVRHLARRGRPAAGQLEDARYAFWRSLAARRKSYYRVTYRFEDEGGISRRVVGIYRGRKDAIPGRVTVVYDPAQPEMNVTLSGDPSRYRWLPGRTRPS